MAKNEALSVGFLFDDTLDSSDGVAQYVKTVGAWLASQGHRVSYLVGETKLKEWADGQVFSMSKNQRVIFNGNRLSIPLPARKKLINRVLKENKFDVLHVQVPYSPFMAQRVINAADDSTAVVGTFHILPANSLAKAGSVGLRRLYGKSLKRFDAIVSVSQPAATFALKSFGLNTLVVPNVVDITRFKQVKEAAKSKSSTRIVFLGRLVERKGAKQLLKAFLLLHKDQPTAKLVIAGDGPLRPQLEKFVKDNNLDEHVEFKGFIAEDDKPALLASADIACFPATGGESFGIVLIEAMAAGAGVVIGGNNPGYASVLGARPELVFDPNDTKAFAEHLLWLLSDQNLVEDLHAWQQEEVLRYDVNTVGKQLLTIYRQAIANRRLNRHN